MHVFSQHENLLTLSLVTALVISDHVGRHFYTRFAVGKPVSNCVNYCMLL